ncbi:hypothetical protein KQI82_06590 [Oscillibacter sp. MSJ-2]|uniref:Uncharacterized protein n=1 Tax=Dysosmobacter acutus TaxID=2841504 RepID=A0ABS6FAL7_9FIRM|nr:hypothetical protein [Dysosmobacter acutus]MBU5626587.1 hypothetical protein [Dysosmobacter acutus]
MIEKLNEWGAGEGMQENRGVKKIIEKVEGKPLLEGLGQLSQSEWSSLQLAIDRLRAGRLTAPDVLRRYEQSRFAGPSPLSALDFHRLETALLSLAEKQGFESVLLSPVSPFGSCSVFGCVDQNNVVGAGRGLEVLADPTNALALELGTRIRGGAGSGELHLCTTARVVRGQKFSGKGMLPHFGIFCMVSRGRDSAGGYSCEKALLRRQIRYCQALYGPQMSLTLRRRAGYTDPDGFLEAMETFLRNEMPEVPLRIEKQEENAYYKGLNFKIYWTAHGETFEVGDGGFVDWMEQLVGNRKERCLISGIGMDRMLLFDEMDTLL